MIIKSRYLSYRLFLAALLVSPLIFFTDRTRNPYLIQERLLQVLFSLSILGFALNSYKAKTIKLPKTVLCKSLILYAGLILLSAVFAFIRYPDYSQSFSDYSIRAILMFIFSALIPFYIVASFSNDKRADILRRVIIAVGSIASAYALIQFAGLDFIWPPGMDPYGQRSISTFGNPNFLAPFLIMVIFWIIYEAVSSTFNSSVLLLLLLNIAGLSITMTRSALLGFLSGFIFIGICLIKDKKVIAPKAGYLYYSALAAVLTGFVISLLSHEFRSRILSIVNPASMGPALTQRLLIWEASINMFIETPFLGRGWGNFEIFYPFYQGELLLNEIYTPLRTHANNAHNFILEHLTQSGILGTASFLLFLAILFKDSMKMYISESSALDKIQILILSAATFAFLVDNMLNVSLFFPMPAIVFWINAGLIAGRLREKTGNSWITINLGQWNTVFVGIVFIIVVGVISFNYRYFKGGEYFFSGFKYSRQGHLDRAEKYLLQSHRYYPRIVDANYELGNVYARLAAQDEGYLDYAINAYKQAILSNPGYDEIYFNLAVMYLRNNQIEDAMTNLKIASVINPVSKDIWNVKGRVYERLGFLEKSRNSFSLASKFGEK